MTHHLVIDYINSRAGRHFGVAGIKGLNRTSAMRVIWRLWVMGLVAYTTQGGPSQTRWVTTSRWRPLEALDTYEMFARAFPRTYKLAGRGKIDEAREMFQRERRGL